MMSKKSLHDPRMYDFWRVVRNNLIPALVLGLLLMLEMVLKTVNCYSMYWSESGAGMGYFSHVFYNDLNLSMGGALVIGAVMALISFSFLLSKKQGDFYLSQTITRQRLFLNRAVAVTLLLAVATAIPSVCMYLVHAFTLAPNSDILLCVLERFAALFVSGMIGFSVTTLATQFARNLPGVCLLISAFVGLPALWTRLADNLAVDFLNGYVYEQYNSIYNALFQKLAPYTVPYGFLNFNDANMEGAVIDALPNRPVDGVGVQNLLPLLTWGLVSVAMLVGAYLLIRRRTTDSGVLFSTRVGRGTVALLCGLLTFWIASTLLPRRFWIPLGIGAAAFVIAFALIWRNAEKFKKNIWQLAVYLVPLVAVYVICITGGFGYSNYMPPISEIESISTNVPTGFLCTENGRVGSTEAGYVDRYHKPIGDEIFATQNSADLQTLYDLHRTMRDDRDPQNDMYMQFSYMLKNGEWVHRQYTACSDETLEALTAVYRTDSAKKAIKSVLDGESDASWSLLERNWVTLHSADMTEIADLNKQSKAWRKKLLQAVYADLESTDFKNMVVPKSAAIGYLYFSDELADVDGSSARLSISAENLNTYGSPINMPTLGYRLYLYSDMQNTLRMLREAGLLSKLEAQNMIQPQTVTVHAEDSFSAARDRSYVGYPAYYRYYAQTRHLDAPKTGKKIDEITDPAVIEKLYTASSCERWQTDGYALAFAFDGYVQGKFIPKRVYEEIVGK